MKAKAVKPCRHIPSRIAIAAIGSAPDGAILESTMRTKASYRALIRSGSSYIEVLVTATPIPA